MVTIHYTFSEHEVQPFIEIIKTVLKMLPEKVQQKIHDQCMIFLLGKTYGYSIGIQQKHLILINVNEIIKDQLSLKEQQCIVAHEFAHFILHHTQSTQKEEQEANNLVLQWGITSYS